MAKIVIFGDFHCDRELNGSDVLEYLQGADCVIGNLEAQITRDRDYPPSDKTAHLRIPDKYVSQLTRLGLSAVTLANNHMMDYGSEALKDTLNALDSVDIAHAGAGANEMLAMEPVFLQAGDTRIGLLSFASTLPPNYQAGPNKAGVAGIRARISIEPDFSRLEEEPGSSSQFIHTMVVEADQVKAVEAVKSVSALADLVLVGMHWGVSLGFSPEVQGQIAEYQEPLGQTLLDAGADIIFGGHPHVVNGLWANDRGIVGYSQGNFVWHKTNWLPGRLIPPYHSLSEYVNRFINRRKREGYLFEIETGGGDKLDKPSVSLIPYILNDQGEPTFPNRKTAEGILRMMEQFSESYDLKHCWIIKDGRAKIVLSKS